jgi:hypothetical protein
MDTNPIENLVEVAAQVAQMLEAALEILQEAQASLPAPTLRQIAEMRRRRRPLTREAWLLGLTQRVLVGAENLASDLRAVDSQILKDVQTFNLSGLEFNAMEEVVLNRASV